MDMTKLPQLAILPGLVRHLLRLDFVDEVYLSGSLGRGQGDRYSDVDLQVAVTRNFSDFLSPTILAELLGAPPLALKQINLGPHLWLHNMILADGTMLDLVCRTDIEFADTEQWTRLDGREWPPIDLEVPKPSTAWAPQAATADEIAEAVELFWVTIHKHRRGLIRKQDLAIWTGIRYSICDLLRLQFIAATDRDPGSLMHMGIYALSGTSNWLENHADWDWRTVLDLEPGSGLAPDRLAANPCRQQGLPRVDGNLDTACQVDRAGRPGERGLGSGRCRRLPPSRKVDPLYGCRVKPCAAAAAQGERALTCQSVAWIFQPASEPAARAVLPPKLQSLQHRCNACGKRVPADTGRHSPEFMPVTRRMSSSNGAVLLFLQPVQAGPDRNDLAVQFNAHDVRSLALFLARGGVLPNVARKALAFLAVGDVLDVLVEQGAVGIHIAAGVCVRPIFQRVHNADALLVDDKDVG